jgi:putative flavoprotein involved in K+ transport
METTGRTGQPSASEYFDVVVIGGGQAGLAAGYHLAQTSHSFCILDAAPEVGHSWRSRWDSLRLFTSARNSALPGLELPGPDSRYPTKTEIADYLASYARHFSLPLRSGAVVERLHREGNFVITVRGQDHPIRAKRVIVATGPTNRRWVPPFAADLDAEILQVHSNDYRNPEQIHDGPVLVVGAGNSGAEIALELSRHQKTYLAGRGTGGVPFKLSQQLDWLLLDRVLNADSPLGKQFYAQRLTRGHPWLRVKESDFATAGITRLERVNGVRDGQPLIAGTDTPKIANVIWSTGYKPDYSWIESAATAGGGVPPHKRGVVAHEPGLYFVGLPFQYSVSSALIGGAGRDAAYVVREAVVGLRSGASHPVPA